MMQRSHRGLRMAALMSVAVIGLSLLGAAPAVAGGHSGSGSGTDPVTIASGLDNPRQLSFTPWGDLLVAEAGKGGAGPCQTGPEGGTVCFGASGAVTRIDYRGRQSRIISGLPSIGGQGDGASAIGPSDVCGVGRDVSVLIGLGTDPANRAGLPAPGQQMGTLIQTTGDYTRFRTIADLAAWEAANNPIDDPDSDPVGLLCNWGSYVVADAGGNTVLGVSPRGRINRLAKFEDRNVGTPPTTIQSVPTSVATVGFDGSYYISELTGFPFPKGAANIYRLDRWGKVTVYATGLTNVTDLAFNGRTLYAVQISTEGLTTGPIGSVVKVKPGGSTPADHPAIASGLFAPYGIAIRGNSAYVTTGAVAAGGGQVIRILL